MKTQKFALWFDRRSVASDSREGDTKKVSVHHASP